MLQKIFKELETRSDAQKGQRCFITIGATHVIGNYENVRLRLEKAGYQVIKTNQS